MTTSSASDCCLVVLLRFPEIGKVKTRIAKTLGQAQALEIYKELYSLTLGLAKRISIPTYLFYAGALPDKKQRYSSLHYLTQIEGDLGEKIIHALNYALQHHQKVIIIGSDCPDLSYSDIHQSIEQLDQHDVVLGPTTDGGYYLLGCKEIIPEIFKSIDWSTPAVFEQTIAKLKAASLTYSLLRILDDIDTEEDWKRYSSGS